MSRPVEYNLKVEEGVRRLQRKKILPLITMTIKRNISREIRGKKRRRRM